MGPPSSLLKLAYPYDWFALSVIIGSSTAPMASSLVPAPCRREKHVFDDVSNATGGP
jgi:hypothetical protein